MIPTHIVVSPSSLVQAWAAVKAVSLYKALLIERRDAESSESEAAETPPELGSALNDGGIVEKARTPTYGDPIRDRSRFSAEIGSVSQPGPLAWLSSDRSASVA